MSQLRRIMYHGVTVTLQIKKIFDMLIIQIAIFTFIDNLIFEIKMYYRCTAQEFCLVKRYLVPSLRRTDT